MKLDSRKWRSCKSISCKNLDNGNCKIEECENTDKSKAINKLHEQLLEVKHGRDA
uniref:Uncharacterized protein n=1 Tax=viral metagenome TaxID=1070528 RepID=A0A6M3IF55_9ZZZZ